MAFLQLHDGPRVIPAMTGKLQPLQYSYNINYPGAPVINPGNFIPFSGCSAQDIYLEFVPQDKKGWEVSLSKAANYKTLGRRVS